MNDEAPYTAQEKLDILAPALCTECRRTYEQITRFPQPPQSPQPVVWAEEDEE